MLIPILDGYGIAQQVIVAAQESILDYSGTISATGIAQVLMPSNLLRSGFSIQNIGFSIMYVNDLSTATVNGSSFSILPNAFFPPHGYPVSTNAVSILGTMGDSYVAREW